MNIPRFLKDILHPLPDPKKESEKFFESPLPHLLFQHIQEIVWLVINEAYKSRGFGLYIKKETLEKEEFFFLTMVDRVGGILGMRRRIPIENERAIFSTLMWEHFAEEVQHYFALAQEKNEAVLNKYNCHLESVRERLLHEVYNVPNKEFHTA